MVSIFKELEVSASIPDIARRNGVFGNTFYR
jgi:hypothetical protein